MGFRVLCLAASAAALVSVAPPAAAQPGPARDFSSYVPTVEAVRIDASEAPVIDGDLSDAVWSRAHPITEFYQVEPVEGAAPSQRTVAYVVYDERNLYVGVYNYDDNPEGIRASQMQRDPQLQDDDGIRIIIDSFGTFRDGFFFATNPNGARNDALLENNQNFRDQWNTIWRVKTRIVEDGWIAEFEIPFQSFSFDDSLDAWNFQIVRTVRRIDEEIRWSNIDRNRNRIDMTNPGKLTGIENVTSGMGLEVQAYATGSTVHDWQTGEDTYALNPSGNVFYKVTPALTASLTFNTDFSDTGLDSRQVNTGRFSLFFPETRDFFLQDAAVFEFGGSIFTNGPVNGLPFFSRRIGIVDGEPVDIVAGAKLSGKLGPANVGMIATRTGAADDIDVGGQYLSAARISMPVLSESKVGVVFTNGDPRGEVNNTVAGADFQYKKSNVFGSGTFTADFAYVQSFESGALSEGDGGMGAAHLAYRSQKWNGNIRIRDVAPNYAPRLGFVNRTGVRRYDMNGWRSYRPQNSFVRYAETGGYTGRVYDRHGGKLDSFAGVWLFLRNDPGDEFYTEYQHSYEDVREPFSIAGVVPVPIGEYTSEIYTFRASSTPSRPVAASVGVNFGTNYNGDYLSLESGLSFRPSKHFELTAEHNFIKFKLDTGEVGIHIASLDSTIAFTPDMTIKTEVQYDNISEAFTFFSRFSWEPRPEQEIFLSFGHTAIIDRHDFPRDFSSRTSSLALRLGHTFRM